MREQRRLRRQLAVPTASNTPLEIAAGGYRGVALTGFASKTLQRPLMVDGERANRRAIAWTH